MNSDTVQQTTKEAQLTEASKAWSDAYYDDNAAAMDTLERQDVIIVDEGAIWNKTKPRTQLPWPKLEVKSHDKVFDLVRVMDDVGLLIGSLTLETNEKNTLIFTEVWEQHNNQWLIVSAHFSSQ
jgi:hypothetical protein